jgi:hypothetical protein
MAQLHVATGAQQSFHNALQIPVLPEGKTLK